MRWAAVLVFAAALSGCTTTAPLAEPDLDQQFDRFLEWFPGRYDSAWQVERDELTDTPAELRNYRRHSIFRRVDLPAFGDAVFLAHQYRDGDPAKVYRQRIYVLTKQPDEQAIRLTVHIPKADGRLDGAYRDPALLDGLTPEEMTVWPGCDLLWRWEGDRFVGRLKPGACGFTSPTFGEVVLDEYIVLLKHAIWFADRGLSPSGEYLFGMRGSEENKSRRVRPFVCVDPDGNEYWTHDQGGTFSYSEGSVTLLRAPDTQDAARLMKLEYMGHNGRTVAVAQADNDAEAITLPDAGHNLSCRHAPDRLYDDGR